MDCIGFYLPNVEPVKTLIPASISLTFHLALRSVMQFLCCHIIIHIVADPGLLRIPFTATFSNGFCHWPSSLWEWSVWRSPMHEVFLQKHSLWNTIQLFHNHVLACFPIWEWLGTSGTWDCTDSTQLLTYSALIGPVTFTFMSASTSCTWSGSILEQESRMEMTDSPWEELLAGADVDGPILNKAPCWLQFWFCLSLYLHILHIFWMYPNHQFSP